MRKLFFNIGTMWGVEENPVAMKSGSEMAKVEKLNDAWLLVENGKIADFGCAEEPNADERIDLAEAEILPGFVDSHTHAVFAAERNEEWVMRIQGKSYEEIAKAGGGILNSAAKLRNIPEDELYSRALQNVKKIIQHGATTIEIKSGYGLDLESELKMLRVIRRIKQSVPAVIKSTFLGAHAVPHEFKGNQSGYVRHIIEEMIPAVAKDQLADHIDVFCDKGFFTPGETIEILSAASAFGIPAKIHANELGLTGGVQAAVAANAWSADHLEHCDQNEIDSLKNSTVMPVGLPGTSYFLGIPYTPVRKLMNAGLPVALASDFNPGSSPLANMQMVWSLACTQMKMLPEEAFNAITINAARALRAEKECGSFAVGKRADFLVTDHKNAMYAIPYYFGQNHIQTVFIAGNEFDM